MEEGTSSNRQLPLTRAGTKRFPDYGWAYYNHLLALYESMPTPTDPEKVELAHRVAAYIKEIGSRKPVWVNWNELATIELLLLEIEPEESMRASAWYLRERYRNIAGASAYTAYEASRHGTTPEPPTGQPSTAAPSTSAPPTDNLRAELRSLLG